MSKEGCPEHKRFGWRGWLAFGGLGAGALALAGYAYTHSPPPQNPGSSDLAGVRLLGPSSPVPDGSIPTCTDVRAVFHDRAGTVSLVPDLSWFGVRPNQLATIATVTDTDGDTLGNYALKGERITIPLHGRLGGEVIIWVVRMGKGPVPSSFSHPPFPSDIPPASLAQVECPQTQFVEQTPFSQG